MSLSATVHEPQLRHYQPEPTYTAWTGHHDFVDADDDLGELLASLGGAGTNLISSSSGPGRLWPW
jgi:hypothetical protein